MCVLSVLNVCVCVLCVLCVCVYVIILEERMKKRWKDLEQGRSEQRDERIEEEGARFSRSDSMTPVS